MSDDTNNSPDPSSIARIVVRPIGSALPLGFFAFAVGTVLLGTFEFRWAPPSEGPLFAAALLGCVAPLELLACVLGFLSRDTGSATAMGVLGSGWIVVAVSFLLAGPSAMTDTLGTFLIMEALAVLCIGIVAVSGKPFLSALLFLSATRFFLAALVQLDVATVLRIPAAVLGLLTGVFAVYGGLALLFEDMKQRAVLPTFRRGAAKRSLEGSIEEQIQRLQHEAGVRRRL